MKLLQFYFPRTPINRTQYFLRGLATWLLIIIPGILWAIKIGLTATGDDFTNEAASDMVVGGFAFLLWGVLFFVAGIMQTAMRIRDCGYKLRYGFPLVLLANMMTSPLIFIPLGSVALFFIPGKEAVKNSELAQSSV